MPGYLSVVECCGLSSDFIWRCSGKARSAGPVKNICAVCSCAVCSCAVCSCAVARHHRAVPCKSCKKLCHIGSKCGNINSSLYSQIKNAGNIMWQCPICAKDEASIENRPPLPLHQDVHFISFISFHLFKEGCPSAKAVLQGALQ